MLKISAMLLFALGFALAGKWAAAVQEKRVALAGEIMLMINIVESQLRYSHIHVTDLLRILCENSGLSELRFIKNCRERVCFGEAFPVAWRESVESESEICRLLPEASVHLVAFGTDIGSTDLESQLSGCEYYRQIFDGELSAQREKSKKYNRLFPPLGILLGISAAIIII